MYTALATIRGSYHQLQWTRIGSLFTITLVAFPIVYGTEAAFTLKFSISIVCFLIHFGLFIALVRGVEELDFYDDKLAEFERLDELDETFRTRIQIFSDKNMNERRSSILSSKRYFGIVGFGLLLLWFAATWQFYGKL